MQQPFAVVVPTVYGPMIVHRMDSPQSLPLFTTGQAVGHGEILLLLDALAERAQGLVEGCVVADVGANFGCFTLAFARAVGPSGLVLAFEPQRPIYHMLCGSIALNGLLNVRAINAVVGSKTAWIEHPAFDYGQPLSFGSVEFGPVQTETLQQERQPAPEGFTIMVKALDAAELQRLDLLKVDAEGMEMDVLHGAEKTIARCRPIIYVEWLKVDKWLLRTWLEARGYLVSNAPGSNFLALP